MIVPAYSGRVVPLEIFMARKYGMGFLGCSVWSPRNILGFDFSPHSIILVTWNPEYRPLGLNRYQGLLTKIDQLSLSFGNIL